MPTLTSYPFQQAYDIPSLTTEIQASSIVTVLDHIDVTGNVTDVWFKDVLSTADQTTLNAVIAAYVYIPPAAPAPIKTIQILGADTLSLSPFGALISPGANTLTTCDIEIPFSVVLRGGVVFSPNSAMGDWFSVSVIDKNNVVGAGGTADNPTILATYIASWYLMPGVVNSVEDVSISQPLPQGLYMRVAYTSVGSVAPSVVVNFITYVGTP